MDNPSQPSAENVTPTPPPQVPAPPVVTEDRPAPLTPMGWLAQNGVYLVLMAVVTIWIYRSGGVALLFNVLLAVVGLSFVIFVHELGHFLVAKWFDVHVMTFSIGFGPAIPGCSFRRGETTYKLSIIPLGGYVRMVGEGAEAEEAEDYPRSFKNKPVGQRMLIISAGVVMNVLLGLLCLTFVYGARGMPQSPAVVYYIDAGSPAWVEGVESGWVTTRISDEADPSFDDLRRKVSLSGSGKRLAFEFKDVSASQARIESRHIEPRRDENNLVPAIGVSPPERLRVLQAQENSAAAAARVLTLAEGERLLATTDPDNPAGELKAIEASDWDELARRLRRLAGQPVRIKTSASERSPGGFEAGDIIVGMTAPEQTGAYNPFKVTELPLDPRAKEPGWRDPFVYHRRLAQLAGKPIVLQVRRGSLDGPLEAVFVPPSSHVVIPGFRGTMGQVAAIRKESSAQKAGVQERDVIADVRLETVSGEKLLTVPSDQLDPLRLPDQLRHAAGTRPGEPKVVWLRVLRSNKSSHASSEPTPLRLDWEERWSHNMEVPWSPASPLSIPELGVAYWVPSRLAHAPLPPGQVRDGNLHEGDVITGFKFPEMKKFAGPARRDGEDVYEFWPHLSYLLQLVGKQQVEMTVRRGGEELANPVTVTVAEDPTWPRAEPGLRLANDQVIIKADSWLQAPLMGVKETWDFMTDMYLGLHSVVVGRVSSKTFGGPIAIIKSTVELAGVDYFRLVFFLGIISLNLAVVNFLPIPLLDGGHMVFLIYEKIRGKPASDQVQAIAAYVGLAMLGFLMLYVFFLDIAREIGWL